MKWNVVLEQNPDTKVWVAEAVGIPGCYTQGNSKKEALENLREVIELLRETDGLPTLAAAPKVELASVEA